jgi:hypothetical protein
LAFTTRVTVLTRYCADAQLFKESPEHKMSIVPSLLHNCCDKYKSKRNVEAEFINNNSIIQPLSCCHLSPVDFDVDVFTNNLVPIYGCKDECHQYSSGIWWNDSSRLLEAEPEQVDQNFELRLGINYSEHDFPNDIWNTRETWEISVKTVAIIPLVVIAILGNLAVIKIVLTKKAMRKNPVNLFIFNMSIADLLCALLFPWIFLVSDIYQRFVLGSFVCRFEGFVLGELLPNLFNQQIF